MTVVGLKGDLLTDQLSLITSKYQSYKTQQSDTCGAQTFSDRIHPQLEAACVCAGQ